MECQYGVQYKKSKFTSESTKVYLQGSRKKGCLAHIIIMQFILYPEFHVHSLLSPNISQNKVRDIKETFLKSLRSALSSEENVKICSKFFLN